MIKFKTFFKCDLTYFYLQTTRPLMSLMLPAVVPSNSTDNESDTIAMMKIDCQVCVLWKSFAFSVDIYDDCDCR